MKVISVKTSRILTLSDYDKGLHQVDGMATDNPSFRESLSPLHFMVGAFKGVPSGTRIKITMETTEEEEK